MLGKIIKLPGFLLSLSKGFVLRLFKKGPKSAYIFVHVALLNLWISQNNKRPSQQRVECPCCGWRGYDFFADDTVKFWLPSVFCPQCGSHERQRMLDLYIHRHDPELPNTQGCLLHFAAERDVRKIFEHNTGLRYFSTEYDWEVLRIRCEPGTGFQADIMQLGVKTDALDIVFCLHVLEHVRRDRDAISEIKRVLKPGGVAYIMVPFDMTLDETEEWEIPDPDIHYHIWAYSTKDFKHRLGVLDYQEITPATFLTEEETRRFRIPPKEIIYRCAKQATPEEPETDAARNVAESVG